LYTKLPVPAELTVKPSQIFGAGLGVFANKFIPKDVRMGPYAGKRMEEKDIDDPTYAWEVSFQWAGESRVSYKIFDWRGAGETLCVPSHTHPCASGCTTCTLIIQCLVP
jgi:hypothetical protein